MLEDITPTRLGAGRLNIDGQSAHETIHKPA
jgi:hypothetical protein